MKVYLLRHGETEGNVKGQFSGVTNTPLTTYGIEQAKEAHLKLEGESFDVVLSSPLSRAYDTAKCVTDQDVELDDELKEMNFGIFEGLTYLEIQDKYPDEFKVWQQEGTAYEFVEGESLKSFYDRITMSYAKIIKKYQGKDLLIVAHSGVIRSILAHEISEEFNHYWKYKIDNCKISIIEYLDDFTILVASNI